MDEGVSPVIGSLLILAITMAGISVTLAWGVPVLEDLRARSSQEEALGELASLRAATLDLGLQGAVRQTGVAITGGNFALAEGTSFFVGLDTGSGGNADCRFGLSGWEDGDNLLQVTVAGPGGCTNPLSGHVGTLCPTYCLEAEKNVDGVTTTVSVSHAAGIVTLGENADLDAIWHLWISDSTPGADVWHAWFFGSDQFSWSMGSPRGSLTASLDGGAAYATRGSSSFMVADPLLEENLFGADEVLLRIPVYDGDGSGVTAGDWTATVRLAHQQSLGQFTGVHRINYGFSGDNANVWCESLRLRNVLQLDEERYVNDAFLSQDCDAALSEIQYTYPIAQTFAVEFLHARVEATLGL